MIFCQFSKIGFQCDSFLNVYRKYGPYLMSKKGDDAGKLLYSVATDTSEVAT